MAGASGTFHGDAALRRCWARDFQLGFEKMASDDKTEFHHAWVGGTGSRGLAKQAVHLYSF